MARDPSAPKSESPAPAGTNYPVLKDKQLIAAANEYYAKQAELKVIEGRLKQLKEQLVTAMHGAPTAYAGVRVLSLTEFAAVPAIPERKIDRTMIGQTIPGKPGRAGYVQLRVQ